MEFREEHSIKVNSTIEGQLWIRLEEVSWEMQTESKYALRYESQCINYAT